MSYCYGFNTHIDRLSHPDKNSFHRYNHDIDNRFAGVEGGDSCVCGNVGPGGLARTFKRVGDEMCDVACQGGSAVGKEGDTPTHPPEACGGESYLQVYELRDRAREGYNAKGECNEKFCESDGIDTE